MGTLKSTNTEPQGYEYNGVILGEPVELDGDPTTYEWDDSAFPNGICYVNEIMELVVIPDDPEL